MRGFRLLAGRILLLLVIGFVCVALTRFAPGFDVDEREWDSRLNAGSIDVIRTARLEQSNVLVFYLHYLRGVITGNLGQSQTFETPVTDLLRQRIPTTLTTVISGWTIGLSSAVLFVVTALSFRSRHLEELGTVLSTAGLGIPAALLGLATLLLSLRPWLAIAVYVAPRCFEMFLRLLQSTSGSASMLAARARGIGALRLWIVYWAPSVAAPLAAVAGLTFSAAFGAAVPIEMITDSPGLGQLAWKAALGRDVPLLLAITFLVGAITLVSNTLADLAGEAATA
ncbi:MAG: ABC transporter permease subunit [Bryobacterales bacterium]|nr:ABC transporter permease subunit [Bryobacterales bacterium]